MLNINIVIVKCGIYKIINLKTGKFYLGSSVNIEKRFTQHVCDLRANRHHSVYLQRSYNKHGEDCFELRIVELCEEASLKEREQKYLHNLYYTNSYNVSRCASGGDLLSCHPNKEAIIKKITAATVERNAQMSENERKEKYGKKGDANPNWRGGDKQNFCTKCGARISPNAKTCRACRVLTGKDNSFYGHTHTQETKRKIREANLGKKPKNMRPVLINNQRYESIQEASQYLNVCCATIIFRIKSKNKKFSGYFYID